MSDIRPRKETTIRPRTEAEGSPSYPAEKARQGEIILRTPLRRFVFIAGLVGLVALAFALRLGLHF